MLDFEKFLLPCFSKTLFNLECLGCGFQRAVLLLLQGQFKAAFVMYPAIYPTLFFIFFISFHYFYKKLVPEKTILIITLINVFFMILGYGYKNYFLPQI
ncbi:DUF2752 domain-containing protein [Flavobacterium ovatum]|uniref:DUF2752 domain-containing protein n=1 Tax=Flavobacterium ovatum TaxID=1928857 RepID=UPI00344B33ED